MWFVCWCLILSTVYAIQEVRHDATRLHSLERRKDLLIQLLELKELKLNVGSIPHATANARLSAIENHVQKIADDVKMRSALETRSIAAPRDGRGFFMKPVIDYGTGGISQAESGNLLSTIIGNEPASAANGPPPVAGAVQEDVLDPNYCTQQAAKVAALKAKATQSLQEAITALQSQLNSGTQPAALSATSGNSSSASPVPSSAQQGQEPQPTPAGQQEQQQGGNGGVTQQNALSSVSAPSSSVSVVLSPSPLSLSSLPSSLPPSLVPSLSLIPPSLAPSLTPSLPPSSLTPSLPPSSLAPSLPPSSLAPSSSVTVSVSVSTTSSSSPTSVVQTVSPSAAPDAAFLQIQAMRHSKFAAHLQQEMDLLVKAGCVTDPDESWASSIANMPISQE